MLLEKIKPSKPRSRGAQINNRGIEPSTSSAGRGPGGQCHPPRDADSPPRHAYSVAQPEPGAAMHGEPSARGPPGLGTAAHAGPSCQSPTKPREPSVSSAPPAHPRPQGEPAQGFFHSIEKDGERSETCRGMRSAHRTPVSLQKLHLTSTVLQNVCILCGIQGPKCRLCPFSRP